MSLATESEFGVSFILHSDSDKDIFKNNNAGAFENIFKKPIQLNLEFEYEICLANIHAPIQQYSLVKNDFEKSYIQYSIGLFQHIDEKWKHLPEVGSKKLWKMAPNQSFMGLDNADTTRDDMRDRRKYFMEKLSRSLKLEDQNPEGTQFKCLKLFKNALDETNGYSFSGKLMGTYDDGEGTFNFDILAEVNQADRYDFFQELLMIKGLLPRQNRGFLKQNMDNFLKPFHTLLETKKNKNDIDDYFTFKQAEGSLETGTDVDIHPSEESEIELVLGIFITMGERMLKFFSLDDDEPIIVGYCGFTLNSPFQLNKVKALPIFVKQKIDSLFIYSDMVMQSIRVGNSLTNLLDIVTVNSNIGNSPSPLNVYKPLANKYLKGGSILIKDQFGETIAFSKDAYTALEIVIRKRQSL